MSHPVLPAFNYSLSVVSLHKEMGKLKCCFDNCAQGFTIIIDLDGLYGI